MSVILNGRVVHHVVIANPELGFVVRYRTNKNGEFVLNMHRSPVTEHLTGKVKIIDPAKVDLAEVYLR